MAPACGTSGHWKLLYAIKSGVHCIKMSPKYTMHGVPELKHQGGRALAGAIGWPILAQLSIKLLIGWTVQPGTSPTWAAWLWVTYIPLGNSHAGTQSPDDTWHHSKLWQAHSAGLRQRRLSQPKGSGVFSSSP